MAKLKDLSGIWSNNELSEREREMLFPLWKAQQDIADVTKEYIVACRHMAERALSAAIAAETRGVVSDGTWLRGDGERAAEAQRRFEQAVEQQRALLSMLKAASAELFESVVECENGPEPALYLNHEHQRRTTIMFIKQITIEGVEGDVEIRHTDRGAVVIANDVEIAVGRDDSREERLTAAYNAAKVICGTTRKGEPNATNSMIHEVLNEIDRVAGC